MQPAVVRLARFCDFGLSAGRGAATNNNNSLPSGPCCTPRNKDFLSAEKCHKYLEVTARSVCHSGQNWWEGLRCYEKASHLCVFFHRKHNYSFFYNMYNTLINQIPPCCGPAWSLLPRRDAAWPRCVLYPTINPTLFRADPRIP